MTTNHDANLDGVTIAEAARRLGISQDAVRQRIKRGTLSTYKVGNRRYVVLPPDLDADPNAPTTAGRPDHDADRDALIAQLRSEIAYLRERIERQEQIIAGLVQRMPPALPDRTATDQPTDPPHPTPEPQKPPLWRRLWPW